MRRLTVAVATMATALAALGASAGSVAALEARPQWTVTSVSEPTNFNPGDPSGEQYFYRVTVANTGTANSDGSPVTITDELPQGLKFDPSGAIAEDRRTKEAFACLLNTCVYSGVVVPDDALIVSFPVDVEAGAPSSVTNVVRAAGGGAPDRSMSTPTLISETPAGYGLAPGGTVTTLSNTQAGAHADLTAGIAWNMVNDLVSCRPGRRTRRSLCPRGSPGTSSTRRTARRQPTAGQLARWKRRSAWRRSS